MLSWTDTKVKTDSLKWYYPLSFVSKLHPLRKCLSFTVNYLEASLEFTEPVDRLWHASFQPLSGLAQSSIGNPSIKGIHGIKVLYCTQTFNCHRVSGKYSPDKCQVLG